MKGQKKLIYLICTIIATTYIASAYQPVNKVQAIEPEVLSWVQEANTALGELTADREVMAVVYLCSEYKVRKDASIDSEVVATIPGGQTVNILSAYLDDEYKTWEYVSFYLGETQYYGYVERDYLACTDERFLEWENNYAMNTTALYGSISLMTMENEATVTGGDAAPTVSPEMQQFPESYRPGLQALKEQHPNWIFVAMNTGLDWNQVIQNELKDAKSLVHKSLGDWTKEGSHDGGNWFYASKEILEYYMDPRNSLTENAIFQYELLTYNESYHTEAAVEGFLNNTFMHSNQKAPGTVMTFAHIFWAIGKEEGRKVSPFHLAARVYQEQGSGNSPLISGTYPGYEGYYNYFNIGASGSSNTEVIINGLNYAKKKNWLGAYYSILGGSNVISENYITKGQDTLYLQKYNVNPQASNPLYSHQYMQNISAPKSEASSIKKLYTTANALDSPFVFKIPVFQNMPVEACPNPTSSTNVVLQPPAGFTDTTIFIDGIAYPGEVRNGRIIAKAADNQAKSAVIYQYNEAGVPVDMYVWTLEYGNGHYTVTPQPQLQNLMTHNGFSIRITGKSGIRMKTGILASVRDALTTTGIEGYTLKEYGTLIMNKANISQYPMILGGEKIMKGMAYGMEENGTLKDSIYETVAGRHRYTAVLVGLPVEQYKTEFAFRGYMTLVKNGVETTIYGPTMARSIYSLSQQLIGMGIYTPGSNADVFLRQIVSDADALP